jgi:phosphoserine phosphatase
VFALPFWLLGGRAAIKRKIAERVQLDATRLPYHAEFVAWLKEEKARGRKLILATASDRIIADEVQRHLGIFDEVIGSDGQFNVKGLNKLQRLQQDFGDEFEYAGNSSADLPIWAKCRSAVVVNASDSVLASAKALGNVRRIFPRARPARIG